MVAEDNVRLERRNFRVIARLDVKGRDLIKGRQFEGVRVLGAPNEFARRYYAEGVDELFYIDNVASLYDRNHLTELLAGVMPGVFVPVTVGGGIRSVDDVRTLLLAGADKIALNTAAVRNPNLISEIAQAFGSQCVVLSIEAKKRAAGVWEVMVDGGREPTGLDVLAWVRENAARGAGEIFVTSIDADGLERGMDLELADAVAEASDVPVIASGGVGRTKHVRALVQETSVDGVAVGSALHYGRLSLRDLKLSDLNDGTPVA